MMKGRTVVEVAGLRGQKLPYIVMIHLDHCSDNPGTFYGQKEKVEGKLPSWFLLNYSDSVTTVFHAVKVRCPNLMRKNLSAAVT